MNKSISLKLIGTLGLAIIIIFSSFSYLTLQSQSDVMLLEMERHTLQLSETIKSSTKYDMLHNHREHILESIKPIGKQSSVLGVRIFNKAGEIIYATDTSQISEMVNKKAEACFGCHAVNEPIQKLSTSDRTRIFKIHPDSANVMGVINPIYNERSCIDSDCHAHTEEETVLGVLDITVCLKSYEDSMAQSKLEIFIFTLLAILSLSAIIWFFVRRLIARPVNDLVLATKTVASGDLKYRIENLRNDELGDLGRSFNNMTQKLSEARMQIFQSDKMASLGRLAAGVAHEINNPLTGILTYSSYLLKRTKGMPDLQNDLAVIVHETKRSRDIVKGLLDFARQSVPKKNKVDLHEIINRAIGVIENQLNINHIRLIKNYASDLPDMRVDSNQMQQVFINLIENASFAVGPDGGTITISTLFTSLEPFGIAQIKQATCPKGHDLLDSTVKIDGMQSIKVNARFNGNEAVINMHPVYGSNNLHRYSQEIKNNTIAEFFCPTCDVSLIDPLKICPKCGAPIYVLEVPSQESFHGCSRKGCDWQEWKFIENIGRKEFVEIKVADTGTGISKEHIDKIFDPFYTTKGQKGTGLGLAVIWGIIDNHDGRIKVESVAGKGTVFIIILPVAPKREMV